MPVLGDVNFNWQAQCRKVEFIRWKKNAHRNFTANKNTDQESQAAFLWNCLGATDERMLESYKWSETDKENVGTTLEVRTVMSPTV